MANLEPDERLLGQALSYLQIDRSGPTRVGRFLLTNLRITWTPLLGGGRQVVLLSDIEEAYVGRSGPLWFFSRPLVIRACGHLLAFAFNHNILTSPLGQASLRWLTVLREARVALAEEFPEAKPELRSRIEVLTEKNRGALIRAGLVILSIGSLALLFFLGESPLALAAFLATAGLIGFIFLWPILLKGR